LVLEPTNCDADDCLASNEDLTFDDASCEL